jgi:hypothetical protein
VPKRVEIMEKYVPGRVEEWKKQKEADIRREVAWVEIYDRIGSRGRERNERRTLEIAANHAREMAAQDRWEEQMAAVRAQTAKDIERIKEQQKVHDEGIRQWEVWAKTEAVMRQPYDVPKAEGRHIRSDLERIADAIEANTEALWATQPRWRGLVLR